jgi:hypothetical protein
MPPELMELYGLYKQELDTRNKNEKENQFVNDINEIIRVRNSKNYRVGTSCAMDFRGLFFIAQLLTVRWQCWLLPH